MKRKADQDTYCTMLLPPPDVRQAFYDTILPVPDGCRVLHPDHYHITLNEVQIPRRQSMADMQACLSAIDVSAFEIRMSDVDMFHRKGHPKQDDDVYWLRPNGRSSMWIQILSRTIHMAMQPAGYAVGRRDIIPHMSCMKTNFNTQANHKIHDWMEKLETKKFPVWPVNEFCLVKSKWQQEPLPENEKGALRQIEIVEKFDLC